MKPFDNNTLCLNELSLQEAQSTNGGSITVLLVCAAATLLLGSCQHLATYGVLRGDDIYNNDDFIFEDQ